MQETIHTKATHTYVPRPAAQEMTSALNNYVYLCVLSLRSLFVHHLVCVSLLLPRRCDRRRLRSQQWFVLSPVTERILCYALAEPNIMIFGAASAAEYLAIASVCCGSVKKDTFIPLWIRQNDGSLTKSYKCVQK